ncbi:hypothetical protein [Streptomyces sp. NPDC046805]|uniref:hypothetical protein n=1 Tax=Streptomyces sp. NPDC046805 TaxID=3155134 RepID=UPI00340A05A7
MDSQEHACPVCGQPVETVVRRHKTLGAWVPVWGPGPCHNTDCAASRDAAAPDVPAAPVTPSAERQQRHGSAEKKP